VHPAALPLTHRHPLVEMRQPAASHPASRLPKQARLPRETASQVAEQTQRGESH